MFGEVLGTFYYMESAFIKYCKSNKRIQTRFILILISYFLTSFFVMQTLKIPNVFVFWILFDLKRFVQTKDVLWMNGKQCGWWRMSPFLAQTDTCSLAVNIDTVWRSCSKFLYSQVQLNYKFLDPWDLGELWDLKFWIALESQWSLLYHHYKHTYLSEN